MGRVYSKFFSDIEDAIVCYIIYYGLHFFGEFCFYVASCCASTFLSCCVPLLLYIFFSRVLSVFFLFSDDTSACSSAVLLMISCCCFSEIRLPRNPCARCIFMSISICSLSTVGSVENLVLCLSMKWHRVSRSPLSSGSISVSSDSKDDCITVHARQFRRTISSIVFISSELSLRTLSSLLASSNKAHASTSRPPALLTASRSVSS